MYISAERQCLEYFSVLAQIAMLYPSTRFAPSITVIISLSVHLTEDQIHRTDNSDCISQQMPSRHLIEAAQMREPWRSHLTPIRSLTTITDNENTHLTLRRLNRAIRLPRRDLVALTI